MTLHSNWRWLLFVALVQVVAIATVTYLFVGVR